MQIATRKRRPGFLQTFWGQSTEGGPKSKYAALSVPRGCFFLRWKLPWCRLLGLHEEWKFQGALQGIWLRVRDQLNILRRKCFRSRSLSFQSSHRAVDAHSGFSSIYLQSRDLWGFYSSCGCIVCCCQLNNYDVGNCRTWMDGLTGLHRWGGQNEAIVMPTFSWHPKYLWTPAVPSASVQPFQCRQSRTCSLECNPQVHRRAATITRNPVYLFYLRFWNLFLDLILSLW